MSKLTTIVPVYDGKYIDECLNSMLLELNNNIQFAELFDIVVVSDGCSDKILDKLKNYETKYDNIKLVQSEHRGPSHARNLGILAAKGEYVTFLDSDDRMCPNFFNDCIKYFENNADLYIFGIKRFEDGDIKYWQVNDKIYNSNNEFADEYILNRHLLVYSNTNKFYKLDLIKKYNLLFDETIEFGEDRLFNFDYIRHCQKIVTSNIYKIEYIKRSEVSLSTKTHKNYFDMAIKMHKEKIKCFLDLANNVTENDKKEFVAYDICNEFIKTISRLSYSDEEKIESVSGMNKFIFDEDDRINDNLGILLVLGSSNCGYRVEKALEISKNKTNIKFIVSGGNLHKSGNITEADFMSEFLLKNGIDRQNIYVEKNSLNTIENLIISKSIIDDVLKYSNKNISIGIITAGFHIKRTKVLASQVFDNKKYNISFFSAYTERTSPDNWYKTEESRNIIISELKKIVIYNFDDYIGFVYDNE